MTTCKHLLEVTHCSLCIGSHLSARRLKDCDAIPISGYVAADINTRLAGAQSWETAPPVLLSTDYYGVATSVMADTPSVNWHSRVTLAPVERPWWCRFGSFNPLVRTYIDGRALDPEVPIEVFDSLGAPEYGWE